MADPSPLSQVDSSDNCVFAAGDESNVLCRCEDVEVAEAIADRLNAHDVLHAQLQHAIRVLNDVPNRRLRSGPFPDTYAAVAAFERELTQLGLPTR